MTNEERLRQLTEKVNAAKELTIKAEARLAELERQEREIREKLKARGFDPERLADEREIRERKLAELLKRAEAILNQEEPAPEPEPEPKVVAQVPPEPKRPVSRPAPAAAIPTMSDDVPW